LKEKGVIIDHDILGWGKEHEQELLKTYQRVLMVGTEKGLERRKPDTIIATYCKANNCDLLTGDLKAYQYFFNAEVKTVQISRYTWIGGLTDKAVFLVEIVD